MASNRDMFCSFLNSVEPLSMIALKNKVLINLHTVDCINYKYFFDDNRYPCTLGYQRWTDNMVQAYIDNTSPTCNFYMPLLELPIEGHGIHDYNLGHWVINRNVQARMYQWNFVRYLADHVRSHSVDCISHKEFTRYFGCLRNYAYWDDFRFDRYISPQLQCEYIEDLNFWQD
jgi:hypothetical protein